MTIDQSADRAEPRVVLAHIALATALPVPRDVTFYPHGLSLGFTRLADGQAWSEYLGGTTDTYVNEGRRYLRSAVYRWHDWSVQLFASEAVTPDSGLDEQTRTALRAVTEVTCTA
jgi:hypothetical protein